MILCREKVSSRSPTNGTNSESSPSLSDKQWRRFHAQVAQSLISTERSKWVPKPVSLEFSLTRSQMSSEVWLNRQTRCLLLSDLKRKHSSNLLLKHKLDSLNNPDLKLLKLSNKTNLSFRSLAKNSILPKSWEFSKEAWLTSRIYAKDFKKCSRTSFKVTKTLPPTAALSVTSRSNASKAFFTFLKQAKTQLKPNLTQF